MKALITVEFLLLCIPNVSPFLAKRLGGIKKTPKRSSIKYNPNQTSAMFSCSSGSLRSLNRKNINRASILLSPRGYYTRATHGTCV
uniref:Putative secreted protein n=1 Tax=Anopheles marajoara TaxID=58244 RepID=A0A2M4CAF9_9DIPT